MENFDSSHSVMNSDFYVVQRIEHETCVSFELVKASSFQDALDKSKGGCGMYRVTNMSDEWQTLLKH